MRARRAWSAQVFSEDMSVRPPSSMIASMRNAISTSKLFGGRMPLRRKRLLRGPASAASRASSALTSDQPRERIVPASAAELSAASVPLCHWPEPSRAVKVKLGM